MIEERETKDSPLLKICALIIVALTALYIIINDGPVIFREMLDQPRIQSAD